MNIFRRLQSRVRGGLDRAASRVLSSPLSPWGAAKVNTDKTIAANRELAEYQYSKDLEMWEKANEYNSPAVSMQRLKAAGLNPNMVYGTGSSGNVAAQMPKYQAPSVSYNYKAPLDLGSVIGLYQNVQMNAAQIDNINARTRQVEEENLYGLGGWRANKMRAEHGLSEYKARMAGGLSVYADDFAMTKLRQEQTRAEILEAQRLFKQYENEWMKAGVTRSDNPLIRAVVRGWNAAGSPMPSFRRNSKGELRKYKAEFGAY